MKQQDADCLTAREAARLLGVSLLDVIKEIRAGNILATKREGLYQIPRRGVLERLYVEAAKSRAASRFRRRSRGSAGRKSPFWKARP